MQLGLHLSLHLKKYFVIYHHCVCLYVCFHDDIIQLKEEEQLCQAQTWNRCKVAQLLGVHFEQLQSDASQFLTNEMVMMAGHLCSERVSQMDYILSQCASLLSGCALGGESSISVHGFH